MNDDTTRQLIGFRRRVSAVWEGPRTLSVEEFEGGFFLGRRVLTLKCMIPKFGSMVAESRSVYRDIKNQDRPGLLRSVYVDQPDLKARYPDQFQSAGQLRTISIPSHTVVVEPLHMDVWIQKLLPAQAPVIEPYVVGTADTSIPIRVLQVDLGIISRVFEKRWQSDDDAHRPLTAVWDDLWEEMGEILARADKIPTIALLGDEDLEASAEVQFTSRDYDPHRFWNTARQIH